MLGSACNPARPGTARTDPTANHSRFWEADNFFFALSELKFCLLVNQALNRPIFQVEKCKKNPSYIFTYFHNLFRIMYHYQTCLFTAFHVSMLYTGVLKSTFKDYADMAEFHAFAQHSVWRCRTTQYDACAWRPVDCIFASFEGYEFYWSSSQFEDCVMKPSDHVLKL